MYFSCHTVGSHPARNLLAYIIYYTRTQLLFKCMAYFNLGTRMMFFQISTNANNLLFYFIFAGNFFLYCVTGERFRSTLRAVCSCLRPSTVFTNRRHGSLVPVPTVVSMTLSTSVELSRPPINATQLNGSRADSSV